MCSRTGRARSYAPYFDIDWHPLKPDLHDKVLLPILGDQYGRVLERGELKVHYEDGSFYLCYYEHRFPIAPGTYRYILDIALREFGAVQGRRFLRGAAKHPDRAGISAAPDRNRSRTNRRTRARKGNHQATPGTALPGSAASAGGNRRGVAANQWHAGDPRSFDTLDALLNDQSYRLAFWRVAAEEINYRRFFDINDLAAIRMELPEVFEATHRPAFRTGRKRRGERFADRSP